MNGIVKYILCYTLLIFFADNVLASEKATSQKINTMAAARLISLQTFEKLTESKYKKFTCTLLDETDDEWIFVYDNYLDEPARPGGDDLMIFISKKTGKVKALWGK